MIEILHRARKYKKSNVQSEIEKQCANDNIEKFGPADDFKASQQTDAKVEEYVTCIEKI